MGSRFALGLLCLCLGACQASGMYRWGDYEGSVYNMTVTAGSADVQAEIASMTETIERAVNRDQPIPPGMHAHLGMLYSLAGDTSNASAAFDAEMLLYPESTVFIKGMLSRAKL